MAKANLGDKQVCPNCSAKFYDLNKRPATCPKCATVFDPSDDSVRLKRTRRAPAYGKTYAEDDEPAEAADVSEDEEEVEETPELDAEGADAVVLETDEDEEAEPVEGDLPPGFSEEDSELEDDAASEDDVPLLEDEEEFNEDELGEISKDDEE